MLQPTGLAVLAALGLAGEIAALGARVERLIGTDAKSGRVVLDVGYRPLGPEVHAIAVHRAALFNVLHDAVVAERLPIRTGFVVESLERSGGGQWLRGPQGLEGPFDLVVDALGSASPLKSEAKVPSRSRPLSFGAIWGTVPWVDAGFRRDALMQRYRKASIMIGVLPVGRQRRDGPNSRRSSGASGRSVSPRCRQRGSIAGATRYVGTGRKRRRISKRSPISSR